MIIEGRAHRPVYIWIHDQVVELRDATAIWGQTTWQTLDTLRNLHNDQRLHTISIGPAGENLVRGACVIQDRGRAFGRCGTGAVMGAKNLKAIAVKGSGAVKVADPQRFLQAVADTRALFKNAGTLESMRKYGTLGGTFQ